MTFSFSLVIVLVFPVAVLQRSREEQEAEEVEKDEGQDYGVETHHIEGSEVRTEQNRCITKIYKD